MNMILNEVDMIINRITAENHLPLEDSKNEQVSKKNKRRKKNQNVKWMKWLGIIMDDSVPFRKHWKA